MSKKQNKFKNDEEEQYQSDDNDSYSDSQEEYDNQYTNIEILNIKKECIKLIRNLPKWKVENAYSILYKL
jgi:hypothetical protein